MKKFISIIFAAVLVCGTFASCDKVNLDGADLKTLTISFDTDGNTLSSFPSIGDVVTKAVVINQGSVNHNVNWTVSVDNDPDWVSVMKTTKISHYVGTYGGDDRDVELQAVTITVDPNTTGAKRVAVLRFTVADGSSISTQLTQSK